MDITQHLVYSNNDNIALSNGYSVQSLFNDNFKYEDYQFNENTISQVGGNLITNSLFKDIVIPAGLLLIQSNLKSNIVVNDTKHIKDDLFDKLYNKVLVNKDTNNKVSKSKKYTIKNNKNKKLKKTLKIRT